MVDEISKLRLRDIKGINILVISHSPFILSDIPKQNVLFLEKGKPVSLEKFKNTNTFAANFSDLLADSFFIGDGLIGDYAKEKINDTIEWLNELLVEKRKGNKLEYSFSKQKEYSEIIAIIDEPIIRNKLNEMYSEIFGNTERVEYLEREKKRIELEIKKLKRQIE